MRYLFCNASVLEVGPVDGVSVVHSWNGDVVSRLQLSHSAGSTGNLLQPRSLLGMCTLLFGRYQEVEVSGWRTPQPSAVLVMWIPTTQLVSGLSFNPTGIKRYLSLFLWLPMGLDIFFCVFIGHLSFHLYNSLLIFIARSFHGAAILLLVFEELYIPQIQSFVSFVCSKYLISVAKDWIVSSQIHSWSHNFQFDAIWRWGLWEIIKFRWGHAGRARDGINGYIRRREMLCLPCEGMPGSRPSPEAGRGALSRNRFASILTLDFPASRPGKSKCLLFKLPSAYGISLSSKSRLD